MCGEGFSPEVAAITSRIGGLGITSQPPPRGRAVGSGEAAFQPPGLRGVGVMRVIAALLQQHAGRFAVELGIDLRSGPGHAPLEPPGLTGPTGARLRPVPTWGRPWCAWAWRYGAALDLRGS
jgi:hypothetical protein